MIDINGKPMEWKEDLTFDEIYRFLGYNLKKPLVVIKVNGEIIKKSERENFSIPDKAAIEVKNILRGG
jgi:thiamine biosynthesis protein ThiS